MEQHERRLFRIARVQVLHARNQRRLDGRIFGRTLGVCIREVAQQRHADQRVWVRQPVPLQPPDQWPDLVHITKNHRHHQRRFTPRAEAVLNVEFRQHPGRNVLSDHPVH